VRILPLTNPDELSEVAETILRNNLTDPRVEQLIEELIADSEVNRRQLVHTVFAIGAAAALKEVIQGHVIGFPSQEN
jgi:hypothetical protein